MIGLVRRDVHQTHQSLSLTVNIIIIAQIEQRLQPPVHDDLHLRDREVRHVAEADTGIAPNVDFKVLQ